MKNAEGLKIGMVAYCAATGKFWKLVGWCGANSLALKEVKPIHRDESRSGMSITWYSFRSLGPNIAVKTNDWYWDNCEVVSYQEIQEILDERVKRQSSATDSTVSKRRRRVQTDINKTGA